MLIAIIISIIVFIGVFYLANLFYPSVEKQTLFWHKKKLDQMSPKLDRMFLDISPARLILLDIASPLICGILGYVITKKPIAAGIFAALGLAIPMTVVRILEHKRRKKFAGQIVDGIMILCSSLKVGMSLQQAFEVLVEEMAAPISQEFSLVIRQMRMGFSVENALQDLKKRMRVDDLDMVVAALLIAKETGGDITETLSKVANTIQERNKLIGKVKALTVQAKLQGIIMSIIPIAFALVVYKSDPHFFDVFFKNDFGKMILGYAIFSQVLGTYFIIKLSKVDF
ncbi:MAG: type II secretion system F family protein [Candidatus Omnitrophica bacterium]|nr:type II secretion system F family protein [Candidatus Omnitrophota bacterium]MDD5512864.1 type II secretion system F family protein [Candidatus Omnitrophota bacterium]